MTEAKVETRHTGIAFEMYVAKYFMNKKASCEQDGKEFTLTINDVRNLLKTRYCAYSGIALTHLNVGSTNITRYTDCTIDRIDNSKGYVKGNVKACAHDINQLKALVENPNSVLTVQNLAKFSARVGKLSKVVKK